MRNDLDEIKKRFAASTPGEWVIRRMKPREHMPMISFIQAPRADKKHPYDIEVLGEDVTLYPIRDGDMDFIAAAHRDVPNLVVEIEALRAQGVAEAEETYLWMLQNIRVGEKTELRFKAQGVLCRLRDFIAAKTGRHPQDVQDDFENRAMRA